MAQATISARIDSDDKIAFEISAPKTVSREEGLKAFYQLREEARKNELQEMTLDEINGEIAAGRAGK